MNRKPHRKKGEENGKENGERKAKEKAHFEYLFLVRSASVAFWKGGTISCAPLQYFLVCSSKTPVQPQDSPGIAVPFGIPSLWLALFPSAKAKCHRCAEYRAAVNDALRTLKLQVLLGDERFTKQLLGLANPNLNQCAEYRRSVLKCGVQLAHLGQHTRHASIPSIPRILTEA